MNQSYPPPNQPPQQGQYAPPQQQQYQDQGQSQEENLFAGSAKIRETNFGRIMRVSLNAQDLAKMQQHLNANGWVTLELMPRRQPSASGATYYGKIDTWQPNQPQGQYAQPQGQGQQYQQRQPPAHFQQPQFQPPPYQPQGQPPPMVQQQYQQQPCQARRQPQNNGGFGQEPQHIPAAQDALEEIPF